MFLVCMSKEVSLLHSLTSVASDTSKISAENAVSLISKTPANSGSTNTSNSASDVPFQEEDNEEEAREAENVTREDSSRLRRSTRITKWEPPKILIDAIDKVNKILV